MERHEAEARLEFLEAAGALKDVMRSGFTIAGRPEDTAAHTWRLCLWVLVFEDQLDGADILRLLKICLLHDLGEAISGDIPAPLQQGDKSADERADLMRLLGPLPPDLRARFASLWEEYTAAASTEAQIAKGLDKLETILQHTQGRNPPGFDHAFNLDYGRGRTDAHPLLSALREIVDRKTMSCIDAAGR
ncbi:HD domain-containing protein [Roseovarius sp. CAU 1744]|uniref:HD domain-containing protein n=1 Tax=Roseovarius sp. CAU 1744 TaxID=3140368 RepID=UPI00325B9523